MPEHTQGVSVSLEGICGCGKSYILTQLRETLDDLPVTFLEKVEDRESPGFDQRILALLKQSNDPFFRSGQPQTETLLLLALKVYDAQATVAPVLSAGCIVIEDRSIDSVAVYQAAIQHPGEPERQLETAQRIFAFASQWRPVPDVTFLIQDDFAASVERARYRLAHIYRPDELALSREIETLYERYAECHKTRIICLDRRQMEIDVILQVIRETVITYQHRQERWS